MSLIPSPDARAVVAAVDRLTTQVRRLADTRPTPGDAPATTADDAEKACPTPLTHNWGCGCPTDEAPAAHTQTLRWARRESLLVLLTRVQHGRTLTDDEARTLRHHVETEMREAEQLRARTDTRRAELEQAQAAIERVRALHADDTALCRTCATPAPCATVRALDGAEQRTT
ncbi:hypothetical protein [Streptomyces albogriseolus]|uniref:hypothetical protein n=1 Tax=Streptomyces albogriseolus TaxID=1887 RepID=UPI003676D409